LSFVILTGLVAWQGWMTLALFGADDPWKRLVDDQPIVSGTHPLHLYFGWLGSSSLYEQGTLECYDPAFQAGYPKTPVFDSGSRPAELFLALAGGSFRPDAYKIGLAVCCLAVPLFLLIAARGAGLSLGSSCLAVALGLLVWWGGPCREMLEAGAVDLLVASLNVVAYGGLLVAFDRCPGMCNWLGLLAIVTLGLFAHPFVLLVLVPLLLVYYLSVGPRHTLAWHVALSTSLGGAAAINSFWLVDWLKSWWLRVPDQLDDTMLPGRTLHALWKSSLWGEPADRALAIVLLGAAALGIVLLNQTRQRPAARLFGIGAGGLLLLLVAGSAWPGLAKMGTSQLLVPALWFAVMPAVCAFAWVACGLWRLVGSRWWAVVPPPAPCWWSAALIVVSGAALLIAWPAEVSALAVRCTRACPLVVGLGPERQALVETLKISTTPEARILWEERPGSRTASRWTALLPLLLERSFIGGFGPDVNIEHAYPSLVDQNLAGRPISDWSDTELNQFCRRYNIGWAVCWSPAAVARFRSWRDARPMADVTDGGEGQLFSLPHRSFLLKGKATWLAADKQRIVLADVVPDGDEVVLSLHYQAGMHGSPGRVRIERELDPHDPIPFVRLRVPGPVARVTLTWMK
jgi:hypothetical protein